MKIYSIYYVQQGQYGLNAVVVADSADQAIEMLNLSDEDVGRQISLLGQEIEGDASGRPWMVAHESL
jgi:hypothetical protein